MPTAYVNDTELTYILEVVLEIGALMVDFVVDMSGHILDDDLLFTRGFHLIRETHDD